MTLTVDPEPLIPFEVWAALSARMLQRDSETRALILEQAGMDHERWGYSDARWTAELVRDLERRNYARVEHYGRECAAELERRRRGELELRANAPGPVSADFADTVSLNDYRPLGSGDETVDLPAFDADRPVLPFCRPASSR